MTHILPRVWFNKTVIDSNQASLHIASSAVLYGLSIYTAFPILKNIVEINGRCIGAWDEGGLTKQLKNRMAKIQAGDDNLSSHYLTKI